MEDDVLGLDVLVDHSPGVHRSQGRGQARGDEKEPPPVQRGATKFGERATLEVLQHQRRRPLVALEPERPQHERRVEPRSQLVLLLEALQISGLPARSERLDDDVAAIAHPDAAVDDAGLVLMQGLDDGEGGRASHPGALYVRGSSSAMGGDREAGGGIQWGVGGRLEHSLARWLGG